MSRFNNPKALSTLPVQRPPSTSSATAPVEANEISAPPLVSPPSGNRFSSDVSAPVQLNILQQACFFILCTYLLSGFANEFSSRLFHGKAYISTVTVVLLPLLLLSTGKALRGLQVPLGRWFLAFGIWLAICAPFSVWKSDTLQLLLNYYFRSFILYFVICACVVTRSQVRKLMFLLGFSNFLVVLTCWKFGSSDGVRFSVQGSAFSSFSNSNELALQLLLGIIVLLFPFFRPGILNKVVSFCIIGPSAIYMLKTGSRGMMLGLVATMIAFLVLSRKRVQVLAVLVPFAALALITLPPETRHRLTNIAIGDRFEVTSRSDASDLGSQMQREQLLKDSVRITFQHPIFGVGPGEFIVADSGVKSKQGQAAAWRKTHNSYTQVSSEAGLPGFVFYLGCLLLCLVMSYRLYRQTVGRKGLEDYAAVGCCMVLSVIAYAICTIFDHLAYTGYLPMTAGIVTASHLLARSSRVLGER